MKNENISYENNPKKFELKLRQNLSSDNHTKDTLINFGVEMTIEAEKREIELRKYQDITAKEMQSKTLAMQFLNNTKSLDLEQIANVLETDFGFLGMANLLRKASGKAKSTRGKKIAKKRHAETYELKAQAIEYWRAHIDPKLSNPKAADLLKKVVSVSHRKLAEYVAEAKRQNIHPAS